MRRFILGQRGPGQKRVALTVGREHSSLADLGQLLQKLQHHNLGRAFLKAIRANPAAIAPEETKINSCPLARVRRQLLSDGLDTCSETSSHLDWLGKKVLLAYSSSHSFSKVFDCNIIFTALKEY